MFQNFLIYLLIVLSLFALNTDLKRREIDYWVCICTGIIIIIGILTSTFNTKIMSYDFTMVDLNLKISIVSAIITYIIFFIIPIGGGDMNYLTAISLYFGVWGTIKIFLLSNIIALIYTAVTSKKYIKEHEEEFKNCSKVEKLLAMNKREIPLMVGICPSVIIMLILSVI